MTDGWMLAIASVAGGLFGALLVGVMMWRKVRALLVIGMQTRLHATMVPLLDNVLERVQSDLMAVVLKDILRVSQQAVEQVSQSAAAGLGSASLAFNLESLELRIDAAFDARFNSQRRALEEMLQGIPQVVHQALQVELDFMAQQQTQRDAAASLRDDERAAALFALISSLRLSAAPAPAPAPAPAHAPASAFTTLPAVNPVVGSRTVARPVASARPPELLLTPLQRAEPVHDEPEPAPELTDEEIDALPPELPAFNRLRKRIMPTPKKPVLRNL